MKKKCITQAKGEIKLFSYAKINLSINVGGLMENGFHSVDMVMQQLSFHDDVVIKYEESDHFEISVKTNKYYLPTDQRNLAYKAAQLMIDKYGDKVRPGRVAIDIFKRIPVAAGLAGGSGNGAAVIHGLNTLWKLRLNLNELCNLGAELGSDVPFSIMGQARGNHNLPAKVKKDPMATSCARATGRGTELVPVRGIRKFVVIAKPAMGVSTAEVYRGIDDCVIEERPDNDRLEQRLNKSECDSLYEDFVNVLENYTLKTYPKVLKLKECFDMEAAETVLMSGSGPTVFGIYGDIISAKKTCRKLRDLEYEAYWTKTTR